MMFSQLHLVRLTALTIVCTIASTAGLSLGQDSEFNDDLDKELEGVTIIEHLDEILPLDLEFIDEDGNTIALGDLLAIVLSSFRWDISDVQCCAIWS